MNANSLFGHTTIKFSSHPENLATEGLAFILNKSQKAKDSFIRYVKIIVNADLPEVISFETQCYDKEYAIPDLVGKGSDGDEILVVESKFWAGLTDNQPVTYLKRLPNGDKQGLLLFIAPEEIRKKLSVLKNQTPPRLFIDEWNRYVIPLYPRIGVEKHEVVDSLLDQIKEIASILS